ncbi:hypothetical protein L3V86_05385, partial [Thiotrichales bacterium 19S11-10]|nr:hypothetical protein [Thiotrichales bacterium 19S11-10]
VEVNSTAIELRPDNIILAPSSDPVGITIQNLTPATAKISNIYLNEALSGVSLDTSYCADKDQSSGFAILPGNGLCIVYLSAERWLSSGNTELVVTGENFYSKSAAVSVASTEITISEATIILSSSDSKDIIITNSGPSDTENFNVRLIHQRSISKDDTVFENVDFDSGDCPNGGSLSAYSSCTVTLTSTNGSGIGSLVVSGNNFKPVESLVEVNSTAIELRPDNIILAPSSDPVGITIQNLTPATAKISNIYLNEALSGVSLDTSYCADKDQSSGFAILPGNGLCIVYLSAERWLSSGNTELVVTGENFYSKSAAVSVASTEVTISEAPIILSSSDSKDIIITNSGPSDAENFNVRLIHQRSISKDAGVLENVNFDSGDCPNGDILSAGSSCTVTLTSTNGSGIGSLVVSGNNFKPVESPVIVNEATISLTPEYLRIEAGGTAFVTVKNQSPIPVALATIGIKKGNQIKIIPSQDNPCTDSIKPFGTCMISLQAGNQFVSSDILTVTGNFKTKTTKIISTKRPIHGLDLSLSKPQITTASNINKTVKLLVKNKGLSPVTNLALTQSPDTTSMDNQNIGILTVGTDPETFIKQCENVSTLLPGYTCEYYLNYNAPDDVETATYLNVTLTVSGETERSKSVSHSENLMINNYPTNQYLQSQGYTNIFVDQNDNTYTAVTLDGKTCMVQVRRSDNINNTTGEITPITVATLSGRVTGIFVDKKGFVFVSGTGTGGVAVYQPNFDGEQYTYSLNTTLTTDGGTNAVFLDQKGIVYIGSNGAGLYIYKPDPLNLDPGHMYYSSPIILTKEDGLRDNRIGGLFVDTRGRIYAGAIAKQNVQVKGFSVFAPDLSSPKGYKNTFQTDAGGKVPNIFVDTNGKIYTAVGGNIKIYNNEKNDFEFLHQINMPSYKTVNSIFVDRNGYIYAGTSGNGVPVFDQSYNLISDGLDDLATTQVNSIFVKGNIYAAAATYLSIISKPGEGTFKTTDITIEPNNILLKPKGKSTTVRVKNGSFYSANISHVSLQGSITGSIKGNIKDNLSKEPRIAGVSILEDNCSGQILAPSASCTVILGGSIKEGGRGQLVVKGENFIPKRATVTVRPDNLLSVDLSPAHITTTSNINHEITATVTNYTPVSVSNLQLVLPEDNENISKNIDLSNCTSTLEPGKSCSYVMNYASGEIIKPSYPNIEVKVTASRKDSDISNIETLTINNYPGYYNTPQNTSRLHDEIANYGIRDIFVKDGIIYLATQVGFSISKDGGNSWKNLTPADGLSDYSILSLFVGNYDTPYVGTSKGLSIGLKTGDFYRWSNKLEGISIQSVFVYGNYIYAATPNGLYISTDLLGNNWNTVLDNSDYQDVEDIFVWSDVNNNSYIYAATNGGLVIIDGLDGNGSQTVLLDDLAEHEVVQSIFVDTDGTLYAGTAGDYTEGSFGSGLYIYTYDQASNTYNTSPQQIDFGDNDLNSIGNIDVANNQVYLGSKYGLAVTSIKDFADSDWVTESIGSLGLLTTSTWLKVAVDDVNPNIIYTGASNFTISEEDKESKTFTRKARFTGEGPHYAPVVAVAASNGSVYNGGGDGFFAATPIGELGDYSWYRSSSIRGSALFRANVLSIYTDGDNVYVGTSNTVYDEGSIAGLYIQSASDVTNSTWTSVFTGDESADAIIVNQTVTDSNYLYVATGGGTVTNTDGSQNQSPAGLRIINRSDNTLKQALLTEKVTYSVALDGDSKVYAGTDGGLFQCENDAGSFHCDDSPLIVESTNGVSVTDSYIYAATTNGLIIIDKTDMSQTPITFKNGDYNKLYSVLVLSESNEIYLGAAGGIIYSNDGGTTWSYPDQLNGATVIAVKDINRDASNGTIYFATSGGILTTQNQNSD